MTKPFNFGQGPIRLECKEKLNAAHKACFDHPNRDALGMSHGPFSGVNHVLGVLATLEDDLWDKDAELSKLKNTGTLWNALRKVACISKQGATGIVMLKRRHVVAALKLISSNSQSDGAK